MFLINDGSRSGQKPEKTGSLIRYTDLLSKKVWGDTSVIGHKRVAFVCESVEFGLVLFLGFFMSPVSSTGNKFQSLERAISTDPLKSSAYLDWTES